MYDLYRLEIGASTTIENIDKSNLREFVKGLEKFNKRGFQIKPTLLKRNKVEALYRIDLITKDARGRFGLALIQKDGKLQTRFVREGYLSYAKGKHQNFNEKYFANLWKKAGNTIPEKINTVLKEWVKIAKEKS